MITSLRGEHNFHLIAPGAALQAPLVAHEHPHLVTGFEQARHQTPTHVAGGPRDQHRT